MSKQTAVGNPDENEEKKMNFEFIDESEIESVKRGRKPVLIPEMIAFFAKAKIGQIVKVADLSIAKETIGTEDGKKAKASASAIIRSQARNAGWKKVAIVWDTNGIPFAKRVA